MWFPVSMDPTPHDYQVHLRRLTLQYRALKKWAQHREFTAQIYSKLPGWAHCLGTNIHVCCLFALIGVGSRKGRGKETNIKHHY